MIAGVSSGFEGELDFEVFLTKPEIIVLEKQSLEGIVIDLSEPKKQKPLQMSVNDGKTAKANFRKHKNIYLNDIVIEADKCLIFICKLLRPKGRSVMLQNSISFF